MDTLLRSDVPPAQPTLLLADDSVTIQRVIALTFLDEGIRVVAVNDGTQAIKVLDQNPPDIVIADVAISEPNGYDLARYIKETPRLAHIPVLLSAGAFEPVDQAKATKAGCAAVLSKPFEPQRVIDRVKEFLSKSAAPSRTDPTSTSSAVRWNALSDLPLAGQMKTDTPGDIDDYFDRLDKAFALLSDASSVSEPPPLSSGSAHRSGRPQPAEPQEAEPTGQHRSAQAAPSGDTAKSNQPASSLKAENETKPSNVIKIETESKASPIKPEAEPKGAILLKPEVDPKPPHVTSEAESQSLSAAKTAPPTTEPVLPPPPEWTFVPARIAPQSFSSSTMPSLAEAFAVLLAAETSEGGRQGIAEWPAAAPIAPATSPDEFVEQVTKRVLERVSDRVVREKVDATVLATAERLIRDEIERIKAHIT